MNININDKIIYLAAGCGIGVVLGVLFAPGSGQETRNNLTNKVDDLTHKVQDKVQHSGVSETAAQTWHNVMERGKNVASNVASIGRQRLNESMDAGRRRFNESIEDDDLVER
jgi:gas vesicle protein